MRRRGRCALAVGQVVAGAVLAASLVTAGVVTGTSPAAAAPAADDLAERLLTVRPEVGPTWVLDVGASTGERLLARTLQGLVNRTEARLYLRDPGDGGSSQHWLDTYEAQGLVTVEGTITLADALERFAGELEGYVIASEAEPWTVQVATTVAGGAGVVVVLPELVDLVDEHLPMWGDLRGLWSDATSAYTELASYRDHLRSDSVAVLRSSDSSFDFAVQQGMLTVFARPSQPEWSAVSAVLAGTPPGTAIYGYLSDTGDEEALAIAALSANDLVLVPSDTTRNLSYHVAVGAGTERVAVTAPDVGSVVPCTADTVNVVVGVTDGDNLNVPLNHFARPANWLSPRRGSLPLAWSMSPALAALAPAAWDTYASTATAADQLVAMAGWGYAAPSLMPDAAGFYLTTFGLMEDLGLRTLWSLGGGLDLPGAPAWSVMESAAGAGLPDVVLSGYGNSVGSQFWSPSGRPAFTSRSVYSQTPADLVGHVRALQATPPGERPLVTFLSATNWSNPVHDLIGALTPLQDEGVRFLTPSEAGACLPEPPVVEPPDPNAPGACTTQGEITVDGLALISGAVEAEIRSRPSTLVIPTAATATPSIAPGGRIDYEATLTVDLPAFAEATLRDRVRPVVLAGYGPELAATASVEMAFTDLVVSLPVPDGTVADGQPMIDAASPGAAASWSDGALEVHLPPITEASSAPGEPFDVTVHWSVLAGSDLAGGAEVVLVPGPLRFHLSLTVGVQLGAIPLTGTVGADWGCVPADGVLATTAVTEPVPPKPPKPPRPPKPPKPPVVHPPRPPVVHPPWCGSHQPRACVVHPPWRWSISTSSW